MERPKAAPGLLAEIAAQAPARLLKKLDGNPRLAEAWTWEGLSIRTEGGETVRLEPEGGVVSSMGQVFCSCLLAPRCLHVVAVLSRLPVAEGALERAVVESGSTGETGGVASPAGRAATLPAAASATATGSTAASASAALLPVQVEAARLLWNSAAELLAGGAASAGTILQGELLRGVHACRISGLHRAAAAGTRVVEGVRALRGEAPEFSLDRFATDLAELFTVAASLRTSGRAEPALLGSARGDYEAVGGLRLFGLLTEAVSTASGYAGVATWLCDEQGRLWSLSDVAPGTAGRARAAYDASAGIGDVTLSHRALGRAGLLLQDATASAQGRLGSGQQVRAVVAEGRRWDEEPLSGLWRTPLADQVGRATVAVGRAGDELLFLEGSIAGTHDAGLVLVTQGERELRVLCVPVSEHRELSHRDDLRHLARATGRRVRVVGRLRSDRSPTIALLAVGPAPAGDRGAAAEGEPSGSAWWRLPKTWAGRCNFGLDLLQASYVGEGAAGAALVGLRSDGCAEVVVSDPLEPLRRRLHRVALGGRDVLPPGALAEVEREAALLARRGLPAAADLLGGFAQAAQADVRDASGALRAASPEGFALAWLGMAAYEAEAGRSLRRAAWLGGPAGTTSPGLNPR
ncbi:MAG: SWIM zinc finger family protein [Planctomycetes bacterium]|nr:SWIM zinc finger family protein [Planctomycetota bacterium]